MAGHKLFTLLLLVAIVLNIGTQSGLVEANERTFTHRGTILADNYKSQSVSISDLVIGCGAVCLIVFLAGYFGVGDESAEVHHEENVVLLEEVEHHDDENNQRA